MMSFRRINKAITQLLGASAGGRFTVTGYERQSHDASEVKGNKRNVQSFFSEGSFPKSRGRANSTPQHEMTFTIGLTVSAAAKCNLAIINAPTATQAQISAALDAVQEAGAVADDLMDELFELVYQILMDARNIDLGLPAGVITERWITSLKKDPPLPQGSLLVLTGACTYTCSADEALLGDVGVPMIDGVHFDLDVGEGDGVIKAGVVAGRKVVSIAGQLYDAETGAPLYDAETGAPIIWG